MSGQAAPTAAAQAPAGGSAPPGSAALRILRGPGLGQKVPLVGERFTIGRRKSSLVLQDPEASGNHAELFRSPQGWMVRDLGSTNGTFLNGQPLEGEVLLQGGDELAIGQTVLVYEAPEEPLPGTVEMPLPSATPAPHVPLGIYDASASIQARAPTVGDLLQALQDPQGTEVLSLEGLGISLNLPQDTTVQLEFLAGPEKGRLVTLSSGNIIIGRYGTDVVVKDQDVSRRHAALDFYGRDQIFMRDLGSTNGCYLNGEKQRFARLQSGDTIVMGRTVMQVMIKDILP